MIDKSNLCPVVGILCIDLSTKMLPFYGTEATSYIDAANVQFLEFAGCRVIPIWSNRSDTYYRDIMQKISGIFLPGGNTYVNESNLHHQNQTNHCVESVGKIYRIACDMNRRGFYFPLWGTCLGLELMLHHAFKGECNDGVREVSKRKSSSLRVKLSDDYHVSKMFSKLDEKTSLILQGEPFAYFCHEHCVAIDKLAPLKTANHWRITAVNRDRFGVEYVATCEHKIYPFYGVQFHPEKVLFDHTRNNIKRNANIVKCAQYFANFFAAECRKCSNIFAKKDARRYLIYNFPIENTSRTTLKMQQCYLFKDGVNYATAPLKKWK